MSGWGPPEVRYTLYPDAPYGYAPARRPGLKFSREEYTHILLACGALIFAFTMAQLGLFYGVQVTAEYVAFVAIASTVAVLTGFLLHELMHKAVAQRYGAWAEFRSSRRGLLFAVITGFLGIVFAAPGAVYIAGNLDPRRNGKVSLAGPLTNLVLGTGFLGLALGLVTLNLGLPAAIFALAAYINVFLGGFNLLPIPPLDGSKVFRWNKAIWVAALAGTIAVYVLGAYYLDVFPRFF